ncbi:MAG TPA: hypothetical protein VFT74_12160 [Isosphaeraceae bacterium]|nr:hypothetical protein [Isosphaeraceae bacterium]
MSSAALHRERAFRISHVMLWIVGLSISLSLPWQLAFSFFWNDLQNASSVLDYQLAAFEGLTCLQEAIGKLALALVPIALVQAARLRHHVRSGAFLLACVGLPWLAEGLRDTLMLRWLNDWAFPDRWPTRITMSALPPEGVTEWNAKVCTPPVHLAISLTVAAIASLILAVGRRRLAPWIRSLLLMLIWTGLYAPRIPQTWTGLLDPLLYRVLPPTPLGALLWGLAYDIPAQFLFAMVVVPAMIARRQRLAPPVWLDTIGLFLWALTLLLGILQWLLLTNLSSIFSRYERLVPFVAVIPASLLAVFVHRRLAPAWNLWLGMGYNKETASPAA